jgi:hypothetical protein
MGSVADLLDEARDAGLEVRLDGDRLAVRGTRSAAAVARRLLDRKPEVAAALGVRTESEVETDEPIDWWEEITDKDREYLLGPTLDDPPTPAQLAALRVWRADRHPGKCFFCGGRTVHHPECFIVAFTSAMPFGRYKGRLVSEVPRDYLVWLLKNSTRLSRDLRTEIERVIRNGTQAPRVLQSAQDCRLMNSEPPGCQQHSRAALTTTQPFMGGSRHG